jgi:tetratricopeptide (TPR) repeat protein
MAKDIPETIQLISWVRERWQKPSTLGLVLLVTFAIGFSLSYQYDLAGITEKITWLECSVVLAIMVLVALGWFISTRLPETPADRIGILIAIDCETKKERQRLKQDFINALRDELMRGNHQQYVVHELSEHRARKIESHETALTLLRRTSSHLIMYGRCRMRTHQNRPTYVLELNASVRHAPIALETSKQFSQDIDLAFPRKALIPETEELRGFEFTRDLVGIASRFILGIASWISGNPVSAFDLHYGVWTELRKKEDEGLEWPGPKRLAPRVASLLASEGLDAANLRFTRRPPNYLEDMKRYLDVAQEIDPNHYGGHLLRGIYFFSSSRDIESAKREIKKAKSNRDAAWLWSSAFLDAYDGRLEEAHKTYQRAFRSLVSDDTALQVETFIVDVLNFEPDKVQLWYCLGMINYFYKEDLRSAKMDFQKFYDQVEPTGNFVKSVEIAKQYLDEINSKLDNFQLSN